MNRLLPLTAPALLLAGCGWLLGPRDTDTDTDVDTAAVDEVPPDTDTPLVFETATAGLCSNGTDDDGDGQTDCDDPGCARGPACDPFAGRRDVVWPDDPPSLDLVRDERASCEVPVSEDWLCGRGSLGRFTCPGGVRGARAGEGADIHLTCVDSDGLRYDVLEDPARSPTSRVPTFRPTLAPIVDPSDPGAPVACGPAEVEHPLGAATAVFAQEVRAQTWPVLHTSNELPLTSPMVPEACDGRADTGLTVMSWRDTVDADRATVILTGHGDHRVLLPEVRGRDTRVTVVPDGDDTWVAVSSEGDCTVPCVFFLEGDSDAIPRAVSWAPAWREPTLAAAERNEPGSFWLDADGAPTLAWSGLTPANEQVRGVARLVDGSWVGRELRCPQDRDDRPDLSAIADLGDVWLTGGLGYLYAVDPDTLLATRLNIPGEWTPHPIDVVVYRGAGRFTPQGEVWASSHRAQDDDRLPILHCRP